MVLSWCNLYTSLFLGIEADVLKAKKLHLIGFTHDQVVKHLLCNLIMCGPNSAVSCFQVKKYWYTKITFANEYMKDYIFELRRKI